MVRFWVFLLATAALLSPASPTEQSEAAVRSVVSEYVQARNQKDADTLQKVLAPDADQLVSNGEWRKGADTMVNRGIASSQRENGSSSIEVESVRFLTSDVALVDGRYRTTSTAGAVRNMWSTLVLKRTQSGWRIAAIRNMLPAPPHA